MGTLKRLCRIHSNNHPLIIEFCDWYLFGCLEMYNSWREVWAVSASTISITSKNPVLNIWWHCRKMKTPSGGQFWTPSNPFCILRNCSYNFICLFGDLSRYATHKRIAINTMQISESDADFQSKSRRNTEIKYLPLTIVVRAWQWRLALARTSLCHHFSQFQYLFN